MFVICVDESVKKAYRKTRRVLSGWLDQDGRRSWSGRLSMEGVLEMRKELASTASKNTSVACYATRKNGKRLLFVVGSRKHFDTDGRYCFKTTETKMGGIFNEQQRATANLAWLCGLLHDIGKASVPFQKKIVKAKQALASGEKAEPAGDPVRHDLVGAMWLFQAAMGENGSHGCDRDWMRRLSEDPKGFFLSALEKKGSGFGKLEIGGFQGGEKGKRSIRKKYAFREFLSNEKSLPAFPVLYAVIWSALSHHRLPAADDCALFSCQNLVNNAAFDDMAEDAEALTVVTDGGFWEDGRWTEAIRGRLGRMISLPSGFWPDTPSTMSSLLYCVVRPFVIMGDHFDSAVIDKQAETAAHKGSRGLVAKDTGRTVADHLVGVGRAAKEFAYAAFDRSRFDSMPPEALGRPDTLWTGKVPERFSWQEEAEHLASGATGQLFGMVVCGTGSGKTVGGARIMRGLAGPDGLRFSLGLGLRTLAIQTGRSYVKDLGMDRESLAVVVGGRVVGASDPDMAKDKKADVSSDDACHADHDVEDMVVQRVDRPSGRLETAFSRFGNKDSGKRLAATFKGYATPVFITSPIAVCTVDHLVACTDLLRGGRVARYVRVMTADLLLDEIDGFSESDFPALARLVHAHACFGNNVVCMSATASPVIARVFRDTFLDGHRVHAWLSGKDHGTSELLVSDAVRPRLFKGKASDGHYADFIKRHLSAYTPKVAADILPLAGDWRSGLTEGCRVMHGCHGTMVDGVRVSAGFIRFNNVERARQMAVHLHGLEEDAEKAVFVCCYHSKMPILSRHRVEKVLDRSMRRGEGDSGFDDLVSGLLAKIDAAGRPRPSEIMIVVCTTSVQETGRDHDYDWAILEPYGARSLVQAAGRVLRHRPGDAAGRPRIFVMSATIRHLEETGDPWGFPGIEDQFRGVGLFPEGKTVQKRFSLSPTGIQARVMADLGILVPDGGAGLPVEDSLTALGSALGEVRPDPCLSLPGAYPGSPLAAMEHMGVSLRLDGVARKGKDRLWVGTHAAWAGQGDDSPMDNPARKLDGACLSQSRFRSGGTTLDVLVSLEADRFYVVMEDGERRPLYFDRDKVKNPHRALVDIDFDNTVGGRLEPGEGAMVGEERDEPVLLASLSAWPETADQVVSGGKRLHFHPLLGFLLSKD